MGRTHKESKDRMQRIALDCLSGMDLDDVINKHNTGRTTVARACQRFGVRYRMTEKVGRKTAHVFIKSATVAETIELLTRLIDSEPATRFTRFDVQNLLGLATRLQTRIDAEENRIKKGFRQ